MRAGEKLGCIGVICENRTGGVLTYVEERKHSKGLQGAEIFAGYRKRGKGRQSAEIFEGFYSLRKTPTTTPMIIVVLKSEARTRIGAMSLFAGSKRM